MTDFSNMTIGELIDVRKANNELLGEANKVAKEYKDQENLIDAAIIVELDKSQSTRAANAIGSVSVSTTEEPKVDDWDAVYNHIIQNNDFALLHKRISATAFRELMKLGLVPPGMSSRTVRRVNFRSLHSED